VSQQIECDHGVEFDVKEAERIYADRAIEPALKTAEIRERFPRLFGVCPKGCGFDGIAYASQAHFLYGDW